MRLEGKRAIVTGGSRGQGEAVVRAFVREGAKVVSLDVNDKLGPGVAEEANAAGPGSCIYIHCNIADRDEVFRVFEEAVGYLGGLDILANVAGVERAIPLEDIEPRDVEFQFGVNVLGTMWTNQAAIKYMKDNDKSDNNAGSIINFGSNGGLLGMHEGGVYSASKAAAMAWTRCAARDFGALYGVRCNSVLPVIMTEMTKESINRLTPEGQKGYWETMKRTVHLGGKAGDPDTDLAPVVVFLASDDSKFITGQLISVDGGVRMVAA